MPGNGGKNDQQEARAGERNMIHMFHCYFCWGLCLFVIVQVDSWASRHHHDIERIFYEGATLLWS